MLPFGHRSFLLHPAAFHHCRSNHSLPLTQGFSPLTPPLPRASTDSRLYAGVHFRSANEDGLKLGRLAAAKVFDRIKPVSARATGITSEAGKKPATGRRLMV